MGWVVGCRKICWVKWKKVCQPISNGGVRVRENNLVQSLKVGLLGVEVGEGMDWWKWCPEEGGVFSGKFCYTFLEDLFLVDGGVTGEEEVVFQYLFEESGSFKSLVFLLDPFTWLHTNLGNCHIYRDVYWTWACQGACFVIVKRKLWFICFCIVRSLQRCSLRWWIRFNSILFLHLICLFILIVGQMRCIIKS